ncbi:DUF4082 domain-containing protein [Streptomyces sp. H39-S7]|uniref:DUF4082 domain-containing protein n=1 Tax=Streptomyces sp. H39-S7 TaxID=3004357 RepID=UPI0022AFF5B3|nr:DUF4082 domain-containing protein [Streptomyces sp. H39-S7]MCZ4119406.1 DUF4082 domain-containing protein [Streptomyces sp. H39-S7]
MLRGGLFTLATALLTAVLPLAVVASAADPCGSGGNPVACENSKPGTPMSDWFSPNAYGNVQGYTPQQSYQAGDTVQFKVQSPTPYHVSVLRLGYYGGDGARMLSTPAQAAVTYPANFTKDGTANTPIDTTVVDGVADGKPRKCVTKPSTGLVDCGNWPVTATWTLPSDAVSGLYIANFDQADGEGVMPYPFIVRNDSSHSDIVVQTDDETWQAYNGYGGQDLYGGTGPAPDGRAYEVSYNRPLDIGGDNGIYGSEYEMISWLEQNGYDVSYMSGLDVSTRGSQLLNHKMFMSSGHDEYWTQDQFTNVLNARHAGVHQTYFAGNEVFWKTRFTPSNDGSNTANRTLTCYKETKRFLAAPDGIPDPSGIWTGTWMDPNSTANGQPFQPQNILTGSLFSVNGYRSDAITVPGTYGKQRLWRNTTVANLTPAQTATFPTGTLGYEWDSDLSTSTRPAGQINMSSTTVDINDGKFRLDYGNTYGNGTATHNLVAFRDQTSHALVFGAGTVQWSWGLTNIPTGNPDDTVVTADKRMQQATVNILADMGLQPKTLQSGLVLASASTDTVGPTISVTSPAANVTVPALKPITISGTAADTGGGVVARVEVSTDGGSTWNPTTGLTSWSYSWTPTTPGAAQIKVRAVDDSVNIGATTTVPLTVGPQQCPCTVWPAAAVPGTVNAGDGSSLELGVKIRSSVPGAITAVRFYKSPANVGTHTGSLWSAGGQRLATGTFTNETASGWQQLNFASPVPVKANTTYVASYFAPGGGYSYDNTFAGNSAGLAPFTALQNGTDGGNGVYHYGGTSAFPSTAATGSNYWVDAVLDTSTASTVPPTVTVTTPQSAATGVPITSPVKATFSEGIEAETLVFTLQDSNGATVPGSKVLTSVNSATFTPSTELALNTTYTASVQASDLWGNTMTAPRTWNFTTSPTPPVVNCPCTLWNSSTVPSTVNVTGDANSLELGTRFQSAVNGYITGVTFYKGPGNTGTHTGSLWSSTGTLLATGTFGSETTSGWQQLLFTTPVPITAGTNYVASYHAPNGNYAVDGAYFTGAHQSYPLVAPADGSGGSNGLYAYGTTSAFPTGTFGSVNYWVGPIFTTTPPALAQADQSTEVVPAK